MTRGIMMLIMAIAGALLAIGAMSITVWISHKARKPELACLISMMLGIALAIILLMLAYWVIPEIGLAVGKSVDEMII